MIGENMVLKNKDVKIICNNTVPCDVFSDTCFTCPDVMIKPSTYNIKTRLIE